MSIKPESQFINGVHRHIPRKVYHMKNHNTYIGGIADCWYSGKPNDLWIEYKFIPVKQPTAQVVPNLSTQQLFWIRDRQREGRHVWVIVGSKDGGVIFTNYDEMRDGISAESYMQKLLTRKQLALQIADFCTK